MKQQLMVMKKNVTRFSRYKKLLDTNWKNDLAKLNSKEATDFERMVLLNNSIKLLDRLIITSSYLSKAFEESTSYEWVTDKTAPLEFVDYYDKMVLTFIDMAVNLEDLRASLLNRVNTSFST